MRNEEEAAVRNEARLAEWQQYEFQGRMVVSGMLNDGTAISGRAVPLQRLPREKHTMTTLRIALIHRRGRRVEFWRGGWNTQELRKVAEWYLLTESEALRQRLERDDVDFAFVIPSPREWTPKPWVPPLAPDDWADLDRWNEQYRNEGDAA